MSEELKPKKKRSSNFSTLEVDLLCNLVVQHSGIIESKKSDALAWQEKLECWKNLASEFNGENNGPPRTVTCLRGKYETFKKDLRKKAARHRQELYKTGGGIMEVPALTPNEQKIYDIISLSITGLSARFDDDGDIEAKFSECEETGDDTVNRYDVATDEIIVIEVNADHDETFDVVKADKNLGKDNEDPKPKVNTWKEWTPKSLKTPTSKSLQVNRNKQFLTKLQASQKVNTLAEVKKELVQLQIQCLKNTMNYEEQLIVIKVKKAEEELKQTQLDIEIKQIEKKIKEETLKQILKKNYSFDL